ncbi:unnamed protein product [Polarella glacialis]|uniref:Laminin G domain-containing protein n=1 Tax=Polarella glacialis TaxID=89957 RepID=A0A813LKL1_POLGL|nr:unnamed protein product [Polarella glacialis]
MLPIAKKARSTASAALCRLLLCGAVVQQAGSDSVWKPDPAPAFFCAYDCSASGRDAHPGSCYVKDSVYQSVDSWLKLTTRTDQGGLIPDFIPEWLALTDGDATWEGWFRIRSPPTELTSLFGTFDREQVLFSGSNRRRHAAVWIDTQGALSMSTNAGSSSGLISGPVVSDDKWHHVAAIWSKAAGNGTLITRSFKLFHIDYSVMDGVFIEELGNNIKAAVAFESGAMPDDVAVYLADIAILPEQGRTSLRWTVNAPVETVDMMLAKMLRSETFLQSMRGALFSTSSIDPVITGFLTPLSENVYIYDVTFPTIEYVGGAALYVDGIKQPGRLTFDVLDDNIGVDGSFLIGGGYLGRSLDCHLSRMRLWDKDLSPEQLAKVKLCEPQGPGRRTLVGGDWPYHLYADFKLSGDTTNAIGPFSGPGQVPMAMLEDTGAGGGFVRGGLCNYDECPATGPENDCPLGRSLGFPSESECETFKNFNFCRLAGQSRGRPNMPHLNGCHVTA